MRNYSHNADHDRCSDLDFTQLVQDLELLVRLHVAANIIEWRLENEGKREKYVISELSQ